MIKLNKNIKKMITIFMLAIIIISSLPLSAFASYITDMNSNAQFGVVSGSLATYGHELHYTNYDGNTYMLFCAQYGETSPNGGNYEYNTQFKIELNSGAYQKIAEYIYFGYTMKYGVGLPNSTEAKIAACATQQFVWEYIKNNINSQFGAPGRDSWKNGYMSSSIYSSWLSETESLYNNYHYANVSFNKQTGKVTIGENKTFTDTNGVLSSYQSFNQSANGITFSHTQGSNDLVVSVDGNANANSASFSSNSYGIYRLMPNGAQYSSHEMSSYMYFHFTSGTVQDLIFSSYVDPTFFSFNIEVESGKISLKKVNNIGNAISGCQFELYSDSNCSNKVNSGTTSSDGTILFEKLKPGTYYIKETAVATGYLIDENVKNVLVNAGETASVEFNNNEHTGEIYIYKVNDNGDPVGNAEFTVKASEKITNVAGTRTYFNKGDVVATIISDTKTGIASIKELPMGQYTVQESKASTGYLLNNKIYNAKLEFINNKTPIVELKIEGVVNDEPTGTITIVKKDSETGSVAQGDASLENAKYDVYANEDIWNKAHTIKHYSKGDLVATRTTDDRGTTTDVTGLPLGKYVVKETVSSLGYLLDTKEYEVNLEYKDQKTEIISKIVTSNEVVKKMQVHIFKSGIKENSGLTPGLEGARFSIKLNSAVEKAYSQGYTYAEVWGGIDENGNKVEVDSKRVSEAQVIAPTYETIETDTDGNAYTSKGLPYGKYICKEVYTPADYETAEDFTFSITQDESEVAEIAQKVKHLVVNNEQLEAYIKLIKKDAKTDKTVSLSSATFEIKATKDIYDRATGKIIWKKGETITQKIGSTTYSSFTTNAENIVVPADDSYNNKNDEIGSVTTPLKLPVGSYAVYEINTPEGFLELEKPVNFDIKAIRDYDKDKDEDAIKEVTVTNEQPTGTLVIDKSIALKENVDTSFVDISDLSGIQFKLTAKTDIIDKADGNIIYSKGQEVGTYDLDKNGDLKVEKLPIGEYELQEIKTLDGLVLNDKIYDVKFEKKDNTTKVYTETMEIINDTTLIEISKTTITGDKELTGAELSIIDENGKVIDTWTSTDKTHTMEGLTVGKEYTLKEDLAPLGYTKATEVKFKIENTNDTQKIVMVDKVVTMSKVDIGGNELEGAKIQVIDKENNIVDEWISAKEPHIINNLEENETYTLHEEVSIDGYVKATDIKFTVTEDKNTQHIELVDKIVLISKTDLVTGEELPGAELIVTDKDGNEVDRWTSTDTPHQVTGLEEGKEYTLTEITCPYGYEQAESITFKVSTDKATQTIEMKDMPILKDVKLIKIDSDTKEVIKSKFTFGLYADEECTQLIKQVDSNKEEGTASFKDLRFGTYYIKEIKAPKGYEISNEIIKLEINDKGVFVNGTVVTENDEVYSFEFENKQIPKIQTGNEINYTLLISIIVISLLGMTTGMVVLKRKNKKIIRN